LCKLRDILLVSDVSRFPKLGRNPHSSEDLILYFAASAAYSGWQMEDLKIS
jgi:hypothetical protein